LRGTGHRGRRHRSRKKPEGPKGPRREHIEELHPTSEPPSIENFGVWELGDEIQTAIRNMDITVPTPIQKLSIGPVLEGKDVIAKAETGTGKTLAFGAPMMANIDPARSTVLALVLCPTRELAQQVADVLAALALPRGVRTALVVGGDPMHPQIQAIQAGAQVIVGTPGRVLDLYQQRFLSFPWTESVVLDEADKMFEIGFLDDIKKILSYLPEERQTLLFSATFPTEVLKLARAETREPVEVATASGTATVDSIDQFCMPIDEEERALALTRLFEQSEDSDVFLVFCERRTDVDRLMRRMERLPFGVKALHGGYDQASRFRVMSAFRTGEVKALVATDVASRGLDVQHVTHVINFSVPREVEDYTHRIGRTGRAGRTGTAITFITPADRKRWRVLRNRMNWDVPEIEAPARTGRGRDDGPRRERERPRRERSPEDGDARRSRRREPEEAPRGREREERGERTEREGRDRGRRRTRREPEMDRQRDEGRAQPTDEERRPRSRRRGGDAEGRVDEGRSPREARDDRGDRRRGRRREGRDDERRRPDRERSDREGRERPDRERRPDHERSGRRGRGRGEREERSPERGRRTEERPREERRPRTADAGSGGDAPFGAIDRPAREEAPERPRSGRRRESGERREKRERAPEPRREKDSGPPSGPPGATGFGAGL